VDAECCSPKRLFTVLGLCGRWPKEPCPILSLYNAGPVSGLYKF